jgi:hypothetical protein
MASIASVSGLTEVIARLREAQKKTGEGIARGLKKAGLMLQRESQLRVPVNFGNLKASAFTRAQGEGYSTVVIVGYTAAYALYVHESVGMKLQGLPRPKGRGHYWDPQGKEQAKFLEEPARSMAKQLRQVILNEGKVK